MKIGVLSVSFGIAIAVSVGVTYPALSQSTPFYEGKSITIIEGREPGGTGAMRVQAAVPFLRKYIPGNPTIVPQFMPGGGGRKATNHIFSNVKPDGLTMGNVGSGLIANAVLGATGVQYDIDKLILLGAANGAAQYTFITLAKLKLDSIEKLRAHSGLRIGAQTVGHDIYIQGRLFAWLLGLKDPKFITGYSGVELDTAILRGELDARVGIVGTFLSRNPEFLDKGIMDFHVILNIPRNEKHPHPFFAKLTELDSFVKTEQEKKIVALQRSIRMAGSPYVLPPGTPKEQVKILRDALTRTFKDPEFHKEYKKLSGEEPTPILADAQDEAIRELPKDPETIETFKLIASNKPLPPR
jgi:tripartite-type tricarboxylate transporter receptor subunit TctC